MNLRPLYTAVEPDVVLVLPPHRKDCARQYADMRFQRGAIELHCVDPGRHLYPEHVSTSWTANACSFGKVPCQGLPHEIHLSRQRRPEPFHMPGVSARLQEFSNHKLWK